MPLERLALSPQCGFASVAGGNAMGETDQLAKHRLVVEVARPVWRWRPAVDAHTPRSLRRRPSSAWSPGASPLHAIEPLLMT